MDILKEFANAQDIIVNKPDSYNLNFDDNLVFSNPTYNKYKDIIEEASKRYPAIPKGLVVSMINIESGGDPNAFVWTGNKYGFARGLGQFIDETAKYYIDDWNSPADSYNPRKAINGMFKYLNDLYIKTGDLTKAVELYHGVGKDILGVDNKEYLNSVINRGLINTKVSDRFSSALHAALPVEESVPSQPKPSGTELFDIFNQDIKDVELINKEEGRKDKGFFWKLYKSTIGAATYGAMNLVSNAVRFVNAMKLGASMPMGYNSKYYNEVMRKGEEVDKVLTPLLENVKTEEEYYDLLGRVPTQALTAYWFYKGNKPVEEAVKNKYKAALKLANDIDRMIPPDIRAGVEESMANITDVNKVKERIKNLDIGGLIEDISTSFVGNLPVFVLAGATRVTPSGSFVTFSAFTALEGGGIIKTLEDIGIDDPNIAAKHALLAGLPNSAVEFASDLVMVTPFKMAVKGLKTIKPSSIKAIKNAAGKKGIANIIGRQIVKTVASPAPEGFEEFVQDDISNAAVVSSIVEYLDKNKNTDGTVSAEKVQELKLLVDKLENRDLSQKLGAFLGGYLTGMPLVGATSMLNIYNTIRSLKSETEQDFAGFSKDEFINKYVEADDVNKAILMGSLTKKQAEEIKPLIKEYNEKIVLKQNEAEAVDIEDIGRVAVVDKPNVVDVVADGDEYKIDAVDIQISQDKIEEIKESIRISQEEKEAAAEDAVVLPDLDVIENELSGMQFESEIGIDTATPETVLDTEIETISDIEENISEPPIDVANQPVVAPQEIANVEEVEIKDTDTGESVVVKKETEIKEPVKKIDEDTKTEVVEDAELINSNPVSNRLDTLINNKSLSYYINNYKQLTRRERESVKEFAKNLGIEIKSNTKIQTVLHELSRKIGTGDDIIESFEIQQSYNRETSRATKGKAHKKKFDDNVRSAFQEIKDLLYVAYDPVKHKGLVTEIEGKIEFVKPFDKMLEFIETREGKYIGAKIDLSNIDLEMYKLFGDSSTVRYNPEIREEKPILDDHDVLEEAYEEAENMLRRGKISEEEYNDILREIIAIREDRGSYKKVKIKGADKIGARILKPPKELKEALDSTKGILKNEFNIDVDLTAYPAATVGGETVVAPRIVGKIRIGDEQIPFVSDASETQENIIRSIVDIKRNYTKYNITKIRSEISNLFKSSEFENVPNIKIAEDTTPFKSDGSVKYAILTEGEYSAEVLLNPDIFKYGDIVLPTLLHEILGHFGLKRVLAEHEDIKSYLYALFLREYDSAYVKELQLTYNKFDVFDEWSADIIAKVATKYFDINGRFLINEYKADNNVIKKFLFALKQLFARLFNRIGIKPLADKKLEDIAIAAIGRMKNLGLAYTLREEKARTVSFKYKDSKVRKMAFSFAARNDLLRRDTIESLLKGTIDWSRRFVSKRERNSFLANITKYFDEIEDIKELKNKVREYIDVYLWYEEIRSIRSNINSKYKDILAEEESVSDKEGQAEPTESAEAAEGVADEELKKVFSEEGKMIKINRKLINSLFNKARLYYYLYRLKEIGELEVEKIGEKPVGVYRELLKKKLLDIDKYNIEKKYVLNASGLSRYMELRNLFESGEMDVSNVVGILENSLNQGYMPSIDVTDAAFRIKEAIKKLPEIKDGIRGKLLSFIRRVQQNFLPIETLCTMLDSYLDEDVFNKTIGEELVNAEIESINHRAAVEKIISDRLSAFTPAQILRMSPNIIRHWSGFLANVTGITKVNMYNLRVGKDTVKITQSQKISLYMLLQDKDVFDSIIGGVGIALEPYGNKIYNLTLDDVNNFLKEVTPEEKYIADTFWAASEYIREEGNKVSVLIEGKELFTIANYHPILRRKDYVHKDVKEFVSIEDMFNYLRKFTPSVLKQRKENVKAPLILEGVFEAFSRVIPVTTKYIGSRKHLYAVKQIMEKIKGDMYVNFGEEFDILERRISDISSNIITKRDPLDWFVKLVYSWLTFKGLWYNVKTVMTQWMSDFTYAFIMKDINMYKYILKNRLISFTQKPRLKELEKFLSNNSAFFKDRFNGNVSDLTSALFNNKDMLNSIVPRKNLLQYIISNEGGLQWMINADKGSILIAFDSYLEALSKKKGDKLTLAEKKAAIKDMESYVRMGQANSLEIDKSPIQQSTVAKMLGFVVFNSEAFKNVSNLTRIIADIRRKRYINAASGIVSLFLLRPLMMYWIEVFFKYLMDTEKGEEEMGKALPEKLLKIFVINNLSSLPMVWDILSTFIDTSNLRGNDFNLLKNLTKNGKKLVNAIKEGDNEKIKEAVKDVLEPYGIIKMEEIFKNLKENSI